MENIKPRSIHELLQVMLDNQQCFQHGLCCWLIGLSTKISDEEYKLFRIYIRNNAPLSLFRICTLFASPYYWKPGNIKPRIKWLKKHIEKTKPKSNFKPFSGFSC